MEYTISGDSDEYWFLTEAVEMSKDVEGMCLELGIRRGLGTKTIIDAVRQYCPHKTVVAVDPYGNLPYTGREHIGETHYDYTDQMKAECMAALWAYVAENPVSFKYFDLTDTEYQIRFWNGVPHADFMGVHYQPKYSMVHLDAQHTVKDVSRQVQWFNQFMKSEAVITIDDVTPDFIQIEPIKELFTELGWELVKIGGKKAIWRKKSHKQLDDELHNKIEYELIEGTNA